MLLYGGSLLHQMCPGLPAGSLCSADYPECPLQHHAALCPSHSGLLTAVKTVKLGISACLPRMAQPDTVNQSHVDDHSLVADCCCLRPYKPTPVITTLHCTSLSISAGPTGACCPAAFGTYAEVTERKSGITGKVLHLCFSRTCVKGVIKDPHQRPPQCQNRLVDGDMEGAYLRCCRC